MSKWIPDRKVWAGGLTTLVAWLLIMVLNAYAGADIPIECGGPLGLAIGKAVEYFVPQPAKELIAKIDNEIVAAAGMSPTSDVSAAVGAAAAKAVVAEMVAPPAVAADDFDAMMAKIRGSAV